MSISYPVLKYPVKTYCTVSSDFENFSDTAYGKENKIEGYSFEREHPVEKYQVPNLVSDDDTTNIEKEVIEPSQSEGEQEPENQEVIVQEEEPAVSMIDSRLPGIVYIHINEDKPEAPLMLLEERKSETDVIVDISSAIDNQKAYQANQELFLCICKVVFRESGNQPFLGKLFVAEGLVSRIASGVYGSDIPAILKQGGYGAELDENGVYHVYHLDGTEVIDVPQADIDAAILALSGTTISKEILEKATQVRNEQYSLSLGPECYQYGSIYHYAPDLVGEKELNKRVINCVPVSFEYYDHAFYGFWLNKKYAMNIV